MRSCNHVICRNQGSSAVLRLARLTHDSDLPGPRPWGWDFSPNDLTDAEFGNGGAIGCLHATGHRRRGSGRWGICRNVPLQSCANKHWRRLMNKTPANLSYRDEIDLSSWCRGPMTIVGLKSNHLTNKANTYRNSKLKNATSAKHGTTQIKLNENWRRVCFQFVTLDWLIYKLVSSPWLVLPGFNFNQLNISAN